MRIITTFCAFFVFATTTLAQQSNENDSTKIELLNEVIVSSAQIRDDAPVTLKTIKSKEISQYLGTKTYPEIMRNIGGIYATSESGSYGDAKVNIRGFKQENFTVMLNGVPLSGFRSGSMFWNNWLGLTDATYRIQIQKGVGGSMLAANSMGGTINIITMPAAQNSNGEIITSTTDYGLNSVRISLATGELKNGWSLNFAGSRTWGDGYVDGTEVNSWGYFLTLQKKINTQHSLLFTLLGSPERHGQRSQKLSNEEVKIYGSKYNKNWGEHNGKINNVSENFYHKPYFSATHFFNISQKLFLSNTLYFSVGNGGGKWSESTSKRITSYINSSGQIDWQSIISDNINNTDEITLPDGTKMNGFSKNIQSDYYAGHSWLGLKTTLDANLSNHLKLSSGLHYQYFYSWQNEKITDLLGGKFWYEDYGKNSLAGFANRNPIKKVGDYIRLNNGDRDNHLSVYSQFDYTPNNIHAFFGVMFMTAIYQHWDKYNYITDYYSRCVTGAGGNIKTGISVQIAKHQNLYINGGFYSRMPYSNVYFSNNTNEITNNVSNEKNYIAEMGYKFVNSTTNLTINGYYNYWKNKALMSDPYKPLDENQVRYMITGLDAQHIGIELNYDKRITNWLSISAFASLGNWKWKNDVNATIYDTYTNLAVDTLRVFTDGLFVGDAPQTQLGMTTDIKILNTFGLRAECRYNTRMFANFDPAKRTNVADRSQSFRIPSSFVVDVHIDFPFMISDVYANLFFVCNNVFNANYIERGDDGINHDLDSFRGFWSYGRNVQAGLRVRF